MKHLSWVLSAAIALAGLSAQAEVLWRGDFESGDISQWLKADSPWPAERLVVVGTPAREGNKALQVTVQPGDYASSGNRAELVHYPMVSEGQERWYRWSTMWPTDYESPNTWQLFMQWHHTGCCGNPPLSFYVYGEEVRVITSNGGEVIHKLATLSRGVWHDFVFHVMWSADASKGFIEVYYDGELVLPKTMVATLYPGEQNYMKMGLYRNSNISFAQTIFHDGVIEATSAADVQPSSVAPPNNTPNPPGGETPGTTETTPPEPLPETTTPPFNKDDVVRVEGPVVGCGNANIAGLGSGALALLALAGLARRSRR